MPDLKKGLKYFFFFCLTYLMLILLVTRPGIQNTITEQYRQRTESLLSTFFPKATFRVRLDESAKASNSSAISIKMFNSAEVERQISEARAAGKTNIDIDPPMTLRMDALTGLIVPMTFLWSLLLVTPLGWRRFLLAFLSGTIFLTLLVLLRSWLSAKSGFAGAAMGIYETNAFWKAFYQTLARGWTMGVFVFLTILVWVLVAGRKLRT
jgi:hypothetical protein